MVARAGIEPATFHFSGERYYQLSYLAVPVAGQAVGTRSGVPVWAFCRFSDPDGTRTRDLRRDRAAR
jgi:hypothetical protein